jgi:hypothetical protein
MGLNLKTFSLHTVVLIGLIQAFFVIEGEFITYVLAAVSYFLLVKIIQQLVRNTFKSKFRYRFLIDFYFVLGMLALGRGFFEAQDYWDWKNLLLNTGLVMFLPIITFIGMREEITQKIYYYFLKYLLPASLMVFFLSATSNNTDGFARFLSPFYFIIIFFPYIPPKWKLIVVIVAAASIFSDTAARSNIIRILAAFGIMSLYYFRSFINVKFINGLRYFLFFAPILFFLLAVSGTFNVFKMDEYISGDYVVDKKPGNGEIGENDFTSDTRTFIYEEVIGSGLKRGTWLIGESAAGGYITEAFDPSDYKGSKGRQGSEVGILNIFNYMGIIGAIIFSLIFYFASYSYICYSNNMISKLLGLFIAFRWCYSWVEEFTNFDMNSFFLWIMVGLSFSRTFLSMNNEEMKVWIKGIFKNSTSTRPRNLQRTSLNAVKNN